MVTLLLLGYFGGLHADESVRITLKSGDVLSGRNFVEHSSDLIIIEHGVLGVLEIPRDTVADVERLSEKVQAALIVREEATVVESVANGELVSTNERPMEEAFDIFKVISYWQTPEYLSGNLKLGMNHSMGDRQYVQTYLRGKLKIQKLNSPHAFELKGEYFYQETERSDGKIDISSDRLYTDFTYRWQYSEHWFFQNLTTLRKDVLKGIDNEIQNLSGVGYRSKIGEKLELLVGSGIGFQIKSLDSLLIEDQEDLVVNVFQELNWFPLERMKMSQKLNYFRNPNEVSIYNYDFTLSLNYRLTELFGLEMRYTKDFDNGIDDKYGDDSRFQNALTLYF